MGGIQDIGKQAPLYEEHIDWACAKPFEVVVSELKNCFGSWNSTYLYVYSVGKTK